MTNLMKSLGYQVIKILPSWCFKKTQEPCNSWKRYSQAEIDDLCDQIGFSPFAPETPQEEQERISEGINLSEEEKRNDSIAEFLGFKELSREELEKLAISLNQLITAREDEIFAMQRYRSFFDQHWYWITMYLLGIGTGAMGVILYQAFQSTYNLV